MKASFLPKTNETILRISALLYKAIYNRAEIFKNNFVGFWEKQCFHKIKSVFTDLYSTKSKNNQYDRILQKK